MLRVVVVDRQPVVRAGLHAILGVSHGVEIVGEADCAGDGARLAARLRPDVVMADARLPDAAGASVGDVLRCEDPTRLLVMAALPTESQLVGALGAGAAGFLAKDSDAPVIRNAVQTVARGETFIDPRVAAKYVAATAGGRAARGPFGLTLQEMRVLELLPQGMSNREIGEALGVSEPTVKTHLRHAMRKLRARDRTQAAAIALRAGIA